MYHSMEGAVDKEAKKLTTYARKHIADKNFAGKKKSYPIHDISHARSALSYGSRFLPKDEYSKLRTRVHKKYPSLAKKSNLTSYVGSMLKESAYDPLPQELGHFVGRKAARDQDARYSYGGAATAALGTAALTSLFGENKWKALRNGTLAIFPGMFAGEAAKHYVNNKK